MQSEYKKSDPSLLIMRNPNESLSCSQESSKFCDPYHPHIEVGQFNGNNNQTQKYTTQNQRQRQDNFSGNQNHNNKMKYMYSFCDQDFKDKYKLQHQNDSENQRVTKNQNAHQHQPSNNTAFNYVQRLTFQNQSVSPFIRIQPSSTKYSLAYQQNQARHSFNPLQIKVNQLQTMCKKLYQMSSEQINNSQGQRETIFRIQQKLDYLLQNLLNHPQKQSTNLQPMRTSNDNKKRSSIPKKTKESIKMKEIQEMNSSEQLSRYLQPPSSSETNSRNVHQKVFYNNSKCLNSNKTKRIKPFMVNSDLHNESSIPELHSHNTIEFMSDQVNKENIDSHNISRQQRKTTDLMKKKIHPISQCNGENKNKYSNENLARKRKHTEKNNEKSTKPLRTKNPQAIKSHRMTHQNLPNKPSQNENEPSVLRQRTKSQNTVSRDRIYQKSSNKELNYEVSITVPQSHSIERQRNQKINHGTGSCDLNFMQTSEIFKAVDFPLEQNQNDSQPRINQSRSTDISRKNKKIVMNNHNKTLLQSIEEKKKLIDQVLSKRLMKNSSILYGGSTNFF